MKTFLFGAVAAIGLALGVAPQDASAHWETRTVYLWDAYCGRYVAHYERHWAPDIHRGPRHREQHHGYYHPPYSYRR